MASNKAIKRRKFVLQVLNKDRSITVTDLTEKFEVSAVTVRRDLDYLAENGLLVRTHGGAIAANHFVHDLPFQEKTKHNKQKKRRIGEKAASLVKEHDLIILDSGTTTLQILRHLKDKKDLTVATNSIPIATEALRVPEIELIVLGGNLRSTSASIAGPHAEKMLQSYSFQKVFLAGDGFDTAHGLTTTDDHEASLNRYMIEAADETIVVVDSSKFGRRGLSRICETKHIDKVITDDQVASEIVHTLEDQQIEVVVA